MLVLWVTLLPTVLSVELLKDADFDSTSTYGGDETDGGWWCVQCDAVPSTDKHTGSHSVKVTNRKQNWGSVTQSFKPQGDHKYSFRAYVKILNLAQGKVYHSMETLLEIKGSNGNSKYEQIGTTPHLRPGSWHIVGGDYHMPNDAQEVRVYFQISEPQVNYLLDTASVEEIPHITDLKSDTSGRIDTLRKNNINIKVTNNNVNPSGLTVEVHQTSSEFGWGSAVDANDITDSQHKKYQDYFYDNFEWAVLENALKWYSMEPSQGQDNVALPEKAVDTLRSKGITVRGHNIFWAVAQWVPNWQKQLSASALKQAMVKRVTDSVGHFKGKLPHWDVNNENVHGDFYAQQLHDPDISIWMFNEAHKAAPNSLLFLNDYNVVSQNDATVAFEDEAQYVLGKGAPLKRLGIQSHFNGQPIDYDLVKHRLDEVARVGLKMWITELDIDDWNENTKADKYESLLRLYFSHPSVEGVMFWGYWDGRHWRPNAALANGQNVTPNAAGRRVKQLIKGEWRTNESHPVREGQNLRVRGFKGGYTVQVKHNGNIIKTEQFTLGDNGVDLTISLSGSGSNPQVNNILVG
ncbi:endo-1,4-beta-xylanase 2-like [Haliotis rubra]|uniref:endo-1,4-beta-xylanase 2-like n=1 Tax=Haliotis rubra TaxID=36100 RepID=UPI001EE52905|nr:endo-1,4-beta-xylanase 2-like [Haliotis rubra]